MKLIIAWTYFFLATSCCFSQREFFLNSLVGEQLVEVNGRQYVIDSVRGKIPTQYPKFDTLIFKTESPGWNEPIICNFKPDSNYSVSVACCGSLDILKTSKLNCDSLKIWDFETDFEKIQKQLMDEPFISIRTKRNTRDSVYAWHADAACNTEHKIVNTELWRLGVPPKCFYWNNITTILFFKTDNKMPSHEETDLEEFLQMRNIVELTSISFRLFDNEKFILTYDEKRDVVTLEYE